MYVCVGRSGGTYCNFGGLGGLMGCGVDSCRFDFWNEMVLISRDSEVWRKSARHDGNLLGL